MKKTFNYLLMSLVAVTLSMGFVACSSDDDEDGGNFETPEFESDAAKYEIEDASSTYSSIELTASGNYVILKNTWSYVATRGYSESFALKAVTFGMNRTQTRASEYANILYGKYTKLADGKYELEGFGILEIGFDAASNAYSLKVTPNGGVTETVSASKTHVQTDGTMTNKLCRTWEVDKMRVCIKYDGRTYFDVYFKTWEEYYQKAYDKFEEDAFLDMLEDVKQNPDNYPIANQFVFTKSGTYVVQYNNESLAVSFWRWYEESEGTLQYSWDDTFESENVSGIVDVEFKSGQCVITEVMGEEAGGYEDDGYGMETIMYYYLNEVK